jgi:hypothetical protein
MVVLMALTVFSPRLDAAYGSRVNRNIQILGAFAMLPAVVGLVRLHAARIARKHSTAVFSAVTLVALFATVGVGLWDRSLSGPGFGWIYGNIYSPLQQAVFSFLAFFIASAAYRAFRARTLETALLTVAAVIVLLGNAVISLPGPGGASAEGWLLSVPAMAMQRGIAIGLALGIVALSARILMGLERGFVGRG